MRLIDADAFSDFIKRAVFEHGYEVMRICDTLTVADVLHSVCAELDGTGLEGFKNAPTVDAVPVRHGRWETVEDYDGDEHYMCSVCGAEFVLIEGDPDDNDYLYCPHCGADMRKDGDGNG